MLSVVCAVKFCERQHLFHIAAKTINIDSNFSRILLHCSCSDFEKNVII